MNRRAFLTGIAGVTAAGIALPGEEAVRRFWRGWSPQAEAATTDRWRDDCRWTECGVSRHKIVLDGIEFPITGPVLQKYDIAVVGGEVMWYDGETIRRLHGDIMA